MPEPSAILVHGFGQEGRIWEQVAARLPFPVLAPDLRGHGTQRSKRPIDESSLVADVLSLVRGSERPLVVGYSMGGRLALRAAIADQSAFGALVLVSAGAGIESDEDRAERRATDGELADLLDRGLVAEFERRWQASPIWDGQPKRVEAAAARMRAEQSPQGLAECLRGFGQGTIEPVWQGLRGLRIPLLTVSGERDTNYCATAERIRSEVEGCELLTIEGVGHSIPLEAPEQLANALADFSRRRLPAGR